MRGSPCIWFLLSVLLGCAMAAGEKRPASFNHDWFKLPLVQKYLLSDFDIFAQGRSIYGLLYDVGYLTLKTLLVGAATSTVAPFCT